MSTARLFAAAAVAIAGAGCVSHRPVRLREVASQDVDYYVVHREWTQELRLYDALETRLLMRATLLSKPFRRAYAAELASRSALSADEHRELLATQLDEADAGWTVVFSSMRTVKEARSFGDDDDDAWRLRLLVDDRPCTFESAERIGRPSATQQSFFLQLNGWADLWEARFASDCGSGNTATLVVAGALGSGEVEWPLER